MQTTDARHIPSTIHLQAIDPARNIARDYRIETSSDLFGYWIVELRWARIGTWGQGRMVSFAEQRDAERFVRAVLARRRQAKRRIGVAYQPVSNSCSVAPRRELISLSDTETPQLLA